MGLLGGLTGALGGLISGGPLGAIAGGIAGLGDSNQQRATSGVALRPWDQQEQQAVNGAYGSLFANQASLSPAQQAAYIQNAAANYYEPMQHKITQGAQGLMSRNAALASRRGMAGSSAADARDRATAIAAGNELASAAAQAQMYGNQQYMNWDANRRANLGAAQGTISSLWNTRAGTSDRYSSTPSSPVGTGLGLMGMGIGMGSPWVDKANSWITGGLGSLFGGGGSPIGTPYTGGYDASTYGPALPPTQTLPDWMTGANN